MGPFERHNKYFLGLKWESPSFGLHMMLVYGYKTFKQRSVNVSFRRASEGLYIIN